MNPVDRTELARVRAAYDSLSSAVSLNYDMRNEEITRLKGLLAEAADVIPHALDDGEVAGRCLTCLIVRELFPSSLEDGSGIAAKPERQP